MGNIGNLSPGNGPARSINGNDNKIPIGQFKKIMFNMLA
jgi:hypothetical protein